MGNTYDFTTGIDMILLGEHITTYYKRQNLSWPNKLDVTPQSMQLTSKVHIIASLTCRVLPIQQSDVMAFICLAGW